MDLFFATNIMDQEVVITDQEAQHILKSKRLDIGSQLLCTDGAGKKIVAEIVQKGKNLITARILEMDTEPPIPYHLTVGISLLKNVNRFEWFVEKAVELGVSAIVPIMCKRTEKTGFRKERIQKIIKAACKQNLRYWLPYISDVRDFDTFIPALTTMPDAGYIAHMTDEEPLLRLEHALGEHNKVIVLIGPEGDFTKDEVESARKYGWKGVSLGDYRLRTETAGIAVCQIVKSWDVIRRS